MPTADAAGPLVLRVEIPTGAGRTIAYAVFPVLAAPALILLVQGLRPPVDHSFRPVGLALLLATIVAGFLLTLRRLRRRPTALEVREKSLLLYSGSRLEVIDWPKVAGLEQVIVGMAPTYAVLFHGRGRFVFGNDDRALEVAREIVRRAGLRWIHEPFSAAR